jgi:hypothetical protein
MEILSTFTFKIKVTERDYIFNITAPSQEEAKKMLLKDLQDIVVQLNTIGL